MCLQIRKKGSISIRSRCPLPRVSSLDYFHLKSYPLLSHKSVGNFEPLKTLKIILRLKEEDEFSAARAKKYFSISTKENLEHKSLDMKITMH